MDHRINVDNLKVMRDFLRNNYDMVQNHLSMSEFCNFSDQDPSLVVEHYPKAIEHCGTTLCLAGWSAVIPEFQHPARGFSNYPRLVDYLFSPHHWVFAYLFGGYWHDVLDEGIDRISTLISAVESGDETFLSYLAGYAEEIQAIHGRVDDWDYVVDDIDGVDNLTEAKEYFPVHNTPDWFLESA